MTTPDAGHVDVAAYALGALNENDTELFEEHLVWCDDCARQLEQLLPAAMALTQVDKDAYVPAEEALRKEHMIERMANVVSLDRRRARAQRTLSIAAAIAVLLVTTLTAGFLGSQLGGGNGNDIAGPQQTRSVQTPDATNPSVGGPDVPEGDRYAATDSTSKASMVVFVKGHAWGTQVAMSLSGVKGPLNCQLVATDRNGKTTVVATWSVPEPGYGTPQQPEELFLEAATGLQRNNLMKLQVVAIDTTAKVTELVTVSV